MNGACTGGAVDAGAPMACLGGSGLCPGPVGSMYCASLMNGFADCGNCGRTCAPGQYCINGTCLLAGAGTSCPAQQQACPNATGSGMFCTDFSKDPANCGACGRICPGGTNCQTGICSAPTCSAPATACVGSGGTFCADLSRDAANCGACNQACAANAICTGGVCQGGAGTYPGLGACTGTGGAPFCTNLLNDQGNCGSCGTKCAATESCFSGTCGTTAPPPVCPAGNQVCTDPSGQKQYCSNVLYDGGNCGRCGNICPAGTGCNNGMCLAMAGTDAGTCPATMKMCGTYCADVNNDSANCGMCGYLCPNGTACSNGACMPAATDGGPPPDGGGISCNQPLIPCDGTYCSDPQNDRANCGGCHIMCTAVQNCLAGKCM
jgi:hypothetical protein